MDNLITVFSFGYWGWGNATDTLIRAVDAVESFPADPEQDVG